MSSNGKQARGPSKRTHRDDKVIASRVPLPGLAVPLASATIESTDDAILSVALDGTISSWNPGAERLYGYRAEEAVGQPLALLVPDDMPGELPKILEHIRLGFRMDHYETVRRHKDGSRVDVSLGLSPLRPGDSDTAAAVIIARAIRERRRAAAEQERTSRLRSWLREDVLQTVLGVSLTLQRHLDVHPVGDKAREEIEWAVTTLHDLGSKIRLAANRRVVGIKQEAPN